MEVMKKEAEEQDEWLNEREDQISKRLQVLEAKQSQELKALKLAQEKKRSEKEMKMNNELEQ
jgi:hypothetical protein